MKGPTKIIFVVLLLCSAHGSHPARAEQPEITYGRDVRPILAKHCFVCHGPDPEARESDLRLDEQSSATADLGGYQAIKPGDALASEVIKRVSSDDDDLRMPPSGAKPPLTPQEIKTLSQWIADGAPYQAHWSFVPPQKPKVPDVDDATWARGEIDRFLLHRMENKHLTPTEQTSKTNLVRRLYLDLKGVNPTPQEVQEFLADERPTAYRRLVDRLLASPDYAERFARTWLDLARYSDTNGYEKDRPRTIWPYRDWVIRSIGEDKPYDQFSIEQIAGDMLPGATDDQKIATGFHRNTMMNEEGGIDPLEYRFYAMVDRVATTGTVWMGLTTGCAQCHTHKYDPITHTDYYALMALMNNADEPELTVETAADIQARKQIQRRVAITEDKLLAKILDPENTAHAETQADYKAWRQQQIDIASDWTVMAPQSVKATTPRLTVTELGSVLASGDVTKREVYTLTMPPVKKPITAIRLEALPHESLPANGPGMGFYEGRKGDFFLSELKVLHSQSNVVLQNASVSYGKISVGNGKSVGANVLDANGSTGWSTANHEGQPNRLVVNFANPFSSDEPWTIELLFERHYAASLGHFRVSVTDRAEEIVASKHDSDLEADLCQSRLAGGDLQQESEKLLQRSYLRTSENLKEQRAPIDRLRNRISNGTRTLILRERDAADQRTTNRHHRGEYLQPKETVSPAVPEIFAPLGGKATDRLSLARWLVSDKNPLVGRVTVNRAWREFFKTGIVRTAGDFGTQSEPPSHPQLIDWLATDFVENGWSLKRLHRQIVMSAAYRQSIGTPPAADPTNRLLSSFPHRRLDAERLRDTLLSASGLMSKAVGGPSVYPPQSPEVTKMAYGSGAWNVSKGGNRYRKSLYTFSKRTAPFAAYMTFDASSGELCIARRGRSTTPLQALTLLNDAMFIEIAQGLSDDTIRELGSDASRKQIAETIFKRIYARGPAIEELQAILAFHSARQGRDDAWMLVARALINTDEAITTP